MKPEVLLAHLRALIERAPDFEKYAPTSNDHMIWLGQAYALISRWNRIEASSFQHSSDFLPTKLTREGHVAIIFGIIHRAIADLEIQVPGKITGAFSAGDVYNFFRALNDVIASAQKSVFVIDPYLDDTVFNYYLNSRGASVSVRLLLTKRAEQLKPAAEKYVTQFGKVLEMRKTRAIHDRVIFIDGEVCWVLGQSLAHAAQSKPTYLLALSPDVISVKRDAYEEIWANSSEI